MNICGQMSPWDRAGGCIREKGHGPHYRDGGLTPKLKKQRAPVIVRGSEHHTADGRVWPCGRFNRQYA